MKNFSILLGCFFTWVSVQASDVISMQYQSVKPANKALAISYTDARMGVYCVYRTGDVRDSLLVLQLAKTLRAECMESPAIQVIQSLNFELLPLGQNETAVSEQLVRDLAAADTLDYVVLVDRFTIKLTHFILLNYALDYRVYESAKDSFLNLSDSRKLPWIQEDKNEADMIETMAASFAKEMMPSWATHHRTLYEGRGEEARRALLAARDFKWKEALPVWMKLGDSQDAEQAAEMYYNVAIGLEATGEYALAQKWMKQSIATYDLDENQTGVLSQINAKLKQAERIREQMQTPVKRVEAISLQAQGSMGEDSVRPEVGQSIQDQLEGTYTAVLPANPGNFSMAKLRFSKGTVHLFVDEYPIPIRSCVYGTDRAVLQLDVMGETVSADVFPQAEGISVVAKYEDYSIPFIGKRVPSLP